MGIAFLGLVGVWALIQGDVVDGTDVRWLLPVPWVLAGLAGLLATTLTSGRRHAVTETGWVDTRSDTRRGRHQRDLGGSARCQIHWLTSASCTSARGTLRGQVRISLVNQ